MSLERINDREYQVITDKQTLRFKITDKQLSDETSYYLVQKALKSIPKDNENFISHRFRYGQRKWKVTRANSLSWLEKLVLLLFPSFKFLPPADIIQFEIDTAFFAPSKTSKKQSTIAIRKNKREWKRITGGALERSDFKRFKVGANPGNAAVTEELYQKGVRGDLALSDEDPFTKLSSQAFQIGEFNFSGRDGFKFENSKMCLIQNGNHLQLVKRKSPFATEENKRLALKTYLDQIIFLYGKEKIAYIDHHYEMDIKKATELTPEHVYRFNIGTTNVEIQDVDGLSLALQAIVESDADNATPFIESAAHLPFKQISAIDQFLKDKTGKAIPSIEDLRTQVPSKEDIIARIYPESKEKERAYTGRKITQVIQSSYSLAGSKEYKPWIDQQEVTQITEELKRCTSWESYHELLAHVLVKKHLVRRHPTEALRVGALIPAPFGKGWYIVKRFVTNQYTYSYELESLCGNLPPIKLYRSTASSEYAAYAKKSIANNFCQVNSPGHLGISMMHEYEKDFFANRTIPVFVAYQYEAEQLLKSENPDLTKVADLLKQSNEAFLKWEATKFEVKTLSQVIRKHDAILNDLFLRFSHILGAKEGDKSDEYLTIHRQLIELFILKGPQSLRIQYRYALRLNAILENFSNDEAMFSLRDRYLMQQVIEDLQKHITAPRVVHQPSLGFQHDFEARDKDSLIKWCMHLRKMAEERKENIELKQNQDLHVSGHSLGGACGAAGFIEQVIKQHRVPLPNRSISLYEYDAPGINDQDNEDFKDFGNTHVELLKRLQMRFKIIRRQEAGDFFPRGGETHLGATYSSAESIKVQNWLTFNAAISERLETATRPEIAESSSFHATRFGEGVLKKDYTRTYYGPSTQGIFDSHGKNQKIDMTPQEAYKIHQYLFYHLWKMPIFFEKYGCEKSRKKMSGPFMWARHYVFGNRTDAHQMDPSLLDIQGVCAVDARIGIISSIRDALLVS